MTEHQQTNQDQIAGWSGPVGQTWVKLDAQLGRQIAPIGEAAIARAAPQPGERVLDVGCGAGATSVELARAVGHSGRVLGLDVSGVLLELARQRAADFDNVSFLEADAQTHVLPAEGFDLLFSRFGVMFFDDPVAAFRNLRAAMRPGGRLAFACWRPAAENPWMQLPLEAAAELFPGRASPDPELPGPFAFAREARIRQVLEDAGWSAVGVEALDVDVGGDDLDRSVQLMLRVGPLGAALREAGASAALMARADALVRPAIARFQTDRGVLFPSATWIATARA